MKYRFHPEAEAELKDAVWYYEDQIPGLGYEFLEEVFACINRILAFPDAWSSLSTRTRRCLTNRFPYGIIYRARENRVDIIAVAHLHRRPGFWKDRK